jgi:hypothetical protein
MKTAFLFSGELRGFKFDVDKLNKNLLGKFSDCDTYFYIPNPTYKVEDYINPTKICYYDEPNHDIDNIKIELGLIGKKDLLVNGILCTCVKT